MSAWPHHILLLRSYVHSFFADYKHAAPTALCDAGQRADFPEMRLVNPDRLFEFAGLEIHPVKVSPRAVMRARVFPVDAYAVEIDHGESQFRWKAIGRLLLLRHFFFVGEKRVALPHRDSQNPAEMR